MLSLSKFNNIIYISMYHLVKYGSISITLLNNIGKDSLKSYFFGVSIYFRNIKIYFVVKPISLSATLYLPSCRGKKASD